MEDHSDHADGGIFPEGPDARPAPRSRWALVVDLLQTAVLALLLFLSINAVSARIRVDGSSMEPTLHSGELLIVSKLHYQLGEPRPGDVIVFHLPQDPEQEYIKRVIGVAGDRVDISGGEVRVNDRLLDEPYIANPPVYDGSWTVPEDTLFVLGDNRNNSSDSRQWGPVPLDFVVGRALVVYWPPDAWRLISSR